MGKLVQAGFEPAAPLKAVGLPTIEHTGAIPVTVQQVRAAGVRAYVQGPDSAGMGARRHE